MSRSMYRYIVPIADGSIAYPLTGDPVAVAASGRYRVEFWAEHDDGARETDRAFQVFGTGHPLPDGAKWVGTCPRTDDGLVWHLFEVTQ